MSEVLSIASSWKGFRNVERLIIFGDSYSSVEYGDHDPLTSTPSDPLGCEFPGDGVWNEEGHPNWVGHLITKYRPGPKYTAPHTSGDSDSDSDGSQDSEEAREWLDDPLLVHDYARGGDTMDGVKRQIEQCFLPKMAGPKSVIRWSAEETLFVIWVGINDCGMGLISEIAMEKMAKQLDNLYVAGARNFLVIDVPPVQRTPAAALRNMEKIKSIVDEWNANLRRTLMAFLEGHEGTGVFLYSSSTFFNSLLDDPVSFGFEADHVRKRRAEIWIDHIHPTSRVHDCLAKDIASFLCDISAAPAPA